MSFFPYNADTLCGADHDTQENRDQLRLAAQQGDLEKVSELLDLGVDPDQTRDDFTGGDTALVFAADNGHVQVVKALLAAGANKDLPNSWGQSALWCACFCGHLECVRVLMEAGADTSIMCCTGDYAGKKAVNVVSGRNSGAIHALLGDPKRRSSARAEAPAYA